MIPKKIQAKLNELGIKGVVDGYFTTIPSLNLKEFVQGIIVASYTCWDKNGNVICSFAKGKSNNEWNLKLSTK